MQDEMTTFGRERWQAMADEAARERRARAIAPVRRAPIREGLAAALVALATRLAPAPPAQAATAGELASQG